MKKSFGSKTLIYPTPVWLIGTYDRNGNPDAATVAWGGVCSSNPPAVAISLRKSRWTYGNILERKAFTVNVPSADQVEFADYCGITSGKNTDKFAKTKYTVMKSADVDAPYIKECPMVIECRLIDQVEIGIHVHFIGEIIDVKVDDAVLGKDGLPDMLKIRPLIYAPEKRSYHGVGEFLGEAFSIGKKYLDIAID